MDKQLKILVVDDEAKILKLYVAALASAGFEALGASGGIEGLRIAEEKKPDLILLDFKMPDLDGIQVLEKLKANSNTKDIKVAFLSAFGDPSVIALGDVAAAKEIGAVTFIKKGLALDALIDQVKELLKQ